MSKVEFISIEGATIEVDADIASAPLAEGINDATTRICLSKVSDRPDVIVSGTKDEIEAALKTSEMKKVARKVAEAIVADEDKDKAAAKPAGKDAAKPATAAPAAAKKPAAKKKTD